MFTEEPSYSTTILRKPPAQEQFFHINVQNEWDFIAEAFIGLSAHPSTQLNQLTLLLESHGIVIHRLPALQSESPSTVSRSPFVNAFSGDQAVQTLKTIGTGDTFFPRDVALVHGNRVIEAPPPGETESSDAYIRSQYVDAVFSRLESAGVQVTRWSSDSARSKGIYEIPTVEKLVDVEGSRQDSDREDEGPRFCPSDILILSPTLLITRLSSVTNNKGLEYLWSALSQPNTPLQDSERDTGFFPTMNRDNGSRAARITTLLVRTTDPDTSATPAHAASVSSPRSPRFGASTPKSPATGYIPLCRALIPISRSVMLYDPVLILEDEARRLKTVLDRVQDVSGGFGGSNAAEPETNYTESRSKPDSTMSYGTFGNLDRVDDDGWQFISVDGLRSISILLVSPQLALLSHAPSRSQSNNSTTTSNLTQNSLLSLSQTLESLGVRAVKLPRADLNERQLDWGVRDAILVLRRESNLATTDDENGATNRDAQQQDEEGGEEGCLGAICASLSACLFESLTSSGASEAASDRL